MVRVLGVVLALAGIAAIGYFFFISPKPEPDAPPSTEETSQKGPQVETDTTLPAHNQNPDLTTDDSGLSKATAWIQTDRGVIKFKFYSKDAPQTTSRIIELIGQGFYNGLSFHRVVPRFVIQGGDPRGDGTGGSGTNLEAEFNNRQHVEGTVAMARAADPNSADSQFYISLGVHPHLDRNYTVFGQVIEGMEAAREIQVGDKMVKLVVE